ncbi:hypothetical protein BC749_102929 [Flavobacterium araucananum]|jgi:hypothetical protein|uniref:Uncharacterized protein n=1 Tax=Flavobacterium araucananum TaxID=946678 RepID=A0A227PB39_9FLAO|nr:hypothetical protein [Flavobacterium araucananum]OXG07110.1 hypothetical protein B0A64_09865 [Flavobacterium araucananum]PWK01353.1 hypothetical protein BC749_102929 [Flavobacterium araucananum]
MKIILIVALLTWGTLVQAQTAEATSGKTTAVAKATPKATKTTRTSVSVSVSNSDNYYSLLANFDTFKTKKIEKLLADNLDNNLLSTDGGSKIWKKESKGETAYSFILKEEKLKVSIDKELVSNETFEKLKALGEKISETLSEN